MRAWVVWAIVAIAVVLVAAIVWLAWRRRRTRELQSTFGPEYERAVGEAGPRGGESELMERRRRRARLEIRPLQPATRQRYLQTWRQVQARFVDAPEGAVADADRLVADVMTERGYPMEDFERRAADISVDHPRIVERYRAAHGISLAAQHDRATTEHLREAMLHYRALFEELLGDDDARRAG